MVDKIKNYIFNKLFFPKVLIIDEPGIIINKSPGYIGKSKFKKRLVFDFEDNLSELQIETKKELGKEKSSDLWYKIGKDLGVNYLIFSGVKKPSRELLPEVLKMIINLINKNGTSIAQDLSFNQNKKTLFLKGKENLVCRKSKESSIYEGIFSGIFSFLIGENIEAKSDCKNCPNECKIVLSPLIKKRYVSKKRFLDEYEKIHFQKTKIKDKNLKSLKEMIQFRKIKIKEMEKFYFDSKVIGVTEPILFKLIVYHFSKTKNSQLLKRSLIKSSEKLASDLFEKINSKKEKIMAIRNMLSSFGWGLPYHIKKEDKVIFYLVNPPIKGNSAFYLAFIINGYINYIYKKNFRLNLIKSKKDLFVFEFHYKLGKEEKKNKKLN